MKIEEKSHRDDIVKRIKKVTSRTKSGVFVAINKDSTPKSIMNQ